MKKIMSKIFLLSLIVSFATSCGSNDSGGSSKSVPQPVAQGDGITEQSGVTAKSVAELKKIFDQKNMSDGVQKDMPIFHVGPAFKSQTFNTGSNFNLNFQSSFCVNLVVWKYGDCKTKEEQYSEQVLNSVNASLNSGSMKIVKTFDNSSIEVDDIIEFKSLDFKSYDANIEVYDKSNLPFYEEMLGQGSSGYSNFFGTTTAAKNAVTRAEVTLVNGQKIEAYLVEFYDSNNYNNRKFVVSPQLPLIANPVAVIESNGYQPYFSGVLQSIGGVRVQSISATSHTIDNNGTLTEGSQIRFPY